MEHRIYVIRAAFKRSHLKATVHQRLKQPAGDQGFSASAGTCRKKYSRDLHLNLLPSSAAGNDIDRILTHHHMIPSDRFGSCRRQLYDIHIRQAEISYGIHGFRHRLQGDAVDPIRTPGFSSRRSRMIVHVSGGPTDKGMCRNRQFHHCFRCSTWHDLQIVCRQISACSPSEEQGHLPFSRWHRPAPSRHKRHLNRNRACARSHIIADRILLKTKLGQRNRTHLFLCHRRLPTKKFLITDPVNCGQRYCLFIARSYHA